MQANGRWRVCDSTSDLIISAIVFGVDARHEFSTENKELFSLLSLDEPRIDLWQQLNY